MTTELSEIKPIDLFDHPACSNKEFPVNEEPKEKLEFCKQCGKFSDCALAEYYKHMAVFWEELGLLNITMLMMERMSLGMPKTLFWTFVRAHFFEAVVGIINRIWYDQRYGMTLNKFSGTVMSRLLKTEYRTSLAKKLGALAHKQEANRLRSKFRRVRNESSSHLNIDSLMKGLPPVKERVHLDDIRSVIDAANELFTVLGFGDTYNLVPRERDYSCEDLGTLLGS